MAHTAARGSLLAAVAAAAGCALALSACSGATPGAVTPAAVATPTAAPAIIAPDPSPTVTTAAPGAVPTGSARTVSETEFFSPSRNITCGINYQSGSAFNGVLCQTLSPRQSVKMSSSGAFTKCTGANCLVGDVGEGTPVLAYGETSRVGPFACVSETSGVTCTVSGHGFTIARAGIVTVRGSAVSTAPPVQAIGLASIAGTWNRHEVGALIANNGSGHIDYADLTRCPSCSFATAPRGTVDFLLTSISSGVATGRVTASSDSANYRVGTPVKAFTSPAAPGRFLNLVFGGQPSLPFCDQAAAGQCGA